jgi:ABC-2 type transport system ATP-binding protein
MAPVLRVRNLRKAFNGNKVLKDISFEVRKDEILGLIGASGSGKTTLLRAVVGYIQADSGEVLINESGSLKHVYHNLNALKKRVGFAAQTPSIYNKLTVFENLDYFGALYNLGTEARLTNINTLLELVELESARDIVSKNLSGGMQRRLDIACALIHDPEILILDEPTADLDPVLAKHIWNLVQKINKRGTTIFVASHHFQDLETLCSRVAILSEGTLKRVGAVQELTGKLKQGQEIHIETYPGNYEKLLSKIKDSLITKKENRGHEMVLFTTKPEKIMPKLLKILNDHDESLVDLNIRKLSLGDVFKGLSKK